MVTAAVLAFAVVFAVLSLGFSWSAARFPLFASMLTIVMASLQLFVDFRRPAPDGQVLEGAGSASEVSALVWTAALVAGAYVMGLSIALPVFTGLYWRLMDKTSWRRRRRRPQRSGLCPGPPRVVAARRSLPGNHQSVAVTLSDESRQTVRQVGLVALLRAVQIAAGFLYVAFVPRPWARTSSGSWSTGDHVDVVELDRRPGIGPSDDPIRSGVHPSR